MCCAALLNKSKQHAQHVIHTVCAPALCPLGPSTAGCTSLFASQRLSRSASCLWGKTSHTHTANWPACSQQVVHRHASVCSWLGLQQGQVLRFQVRQPSHTSHLPQSAVHVAPDPVLPARAAACLFVCLCRQCALSWLAAVCLFQRPAAEHAGGLTSG